jgi:hypothetical protein
MTGDIIIAIMLFVLVTIYLVQKNLLSMIAWLALIYVMASQAGLGHTTSVIVGVLTIIFISQITKNTYERFENPETEKKKEKEPKAAPAKTKDPHVDVGTTILHAYRNLSPEQLGGMRKDTKELLGLQKELMGSLAEMKPAIEQGAELLKTFSTFFGQ